MSQTTINTFFSVRKKLDDQHAAKRRKIALEDTTAAESTSGPDRKDEATPIIPTMITTDAVTSAKDDHLIKKVPDTPDTPQKLPEVINSRGHKKDQKSAVFSLGKAESKDKSARKKLDMKKVKFIKGGKLSPAKKSSNLVTFEKKGSLSPIKANMEALEKAEKVMNKLTPEEIKAKIGKVNKLSDLKAQLKNLKKDPNLKSGSGTKRRLFDSGNDQKPIELEVEVPKASKITSPVKSSPLKASPRKAIPSFIKYADLTQPDKYLPLPSKYKFLTEVFRNVDQIVSMKFNRREIIRVTDIKPAVQNIMRKTFTNHYLRQIRCVFPAAYHYVWEKINDRLGRHTGDYELHMTPNHLGKASGKFTAESLTPQIKVERVKLFQHALLEIVKDLHQDFLKNLNIQISDDKLTKWHRDFDVETCPDIDTADFPPKPHVEKMVNAKEMIAKLAGVNPRLENALKTMETKMEPLEEQEVQVEKPKIRKGLQGLPQHLIDKILAKEKEKRIKDMTQNKEERKDLEILKELVHLAPVIMNCHRSQRKGAAVPFDVLCKVTADSHGRKSVQEMTKLIQTFIKMVPECMELKRYDKLDYVKLKRDSPDVNGVRIKLETLVAKSDVST